MLPKHTKNLLVTFTQLHPKESKQFVLCGFNKELRGEGRSHSSREALWFQALGSQKLV